MESSLVLFGVETALVEWKAHVETKYKNKSYLVFNGEN